MMVTDEQIKAAIACDTHCGMCPYNPPCKAEIEDYAADLLEARELIKEMRNYFGIVRDNSLNPAHTMTQLGLEETTDANHKIALMMLEKSKEYAE